MYVTFCSWQGELPEDPSAVPFIPDVDLSNKPWFVVGEDVPVLAIEVSQNVSRALVSIPTETRQKMGHTLDDMLQGCTWNSKNCGPW